MILIKGKINGILLIKPTILKDSRGYFLESFNQKNINKLLGNIHFVQENESESKKGVLRGLHFQKPPYAQAKLVRCVKGEILDVAVDLRKKSETYGRYEKNILSEKNKINLFIPKGFAHGFIVLSKSAIVSYKVDNYYAPEHESGIYWNDQDLNVDWEFNEKEVIVSEKDLGLLPLSKINSPF